MNYIMKQASRTNILLIVLLSALSLTYAQDKPNIILILADDFGYGSVNAYGADEELVRTPHINTLAEEGMKFLDASTPASICTPTRYGLLTGRYPWRSSLKYGVSNVKDPLLIDPERSTLGDLLQSQGYHTAAVGKWHLGYGEDKPDWTGILAPGPLELGFDYHFGVPQNHDDLLGIYVENHGIYGLRTKKQHLYSRSFYGKRYEGFDAPQRVNIEVMQDLTEKSIDWIKQQDADTPFFLYFAPIAVHHPITPSNFMRGMSGMGPYGDFIQDLDWSVGKLVETLEYMGLRENTLIIFTSDNGGEIPRAKDAPESIAISYGFTPNGGLKGDKHTIWEGGTRVPFILNWPGKVPAGSTNSNMVNLVDIYATLSELLTGESPDQTAEDSYSFYATIQGDESSPTREHMITADKNGMHAIRIGDWKYIDDTAHPSLQKEKPKEAASFVPKLYNLKDDPKESTNLYDQNPNIVQQLKQKLEQIRGKSF